MLNPGKYTATPIAQGVKDKDGAPSSIVVTFQIEGTNEKVDWFGFLNESKRPDAKKHPYQITFDTLVGVLGFKGQDIDELAEDRPFALSKNPVELVLEDNEYIGRDGKARKNVRVKYVNRLNDSLSSAEMKTMPGFSFKAQIMAAKQELGVKSDAKPAKAFDTSADDDIQF
jgi:hypothetical protein